MHRLFCNFIYLSSLISRERSLLYSFPTAKVGIKTCMFSWPIEGHPIMLSFFSAMRNCLPAFTKRLISEVPFSNVP